MRAGTLVPDDMMVRLILNELQTRGWLLSPSSPSPSRLTLSSNSTSSSSSSSDDDFITPTALSAAYPTPQPSDLPSASFILDWFQLTSSQAAALDTAIPINLVVSLSTPLEIILSRIAGRWVHAPSGRVYNTTFNRPKVDGRDDITGEPLTKRDDDDEHVWRERLRKFDETSRELVDHYRAKGVLWEVHGASSDEITPKLFREFERRFVE
jgi:adenylate kinase